MKQTKAQLVAEHLKRRGHISAGTALIEYGYFRLSDAIYRLRKEYPHLIPEGFEIITQERTGTRGNLFGEYHLVQTAAAAVRKQLALAA